jgi:drug/metabolite transporter (DMT)-like permease
MEFGLAIAASVLFALGTVLQQRGARTATDAEAAGAGFLLRLARKPVWLAGMAADLAGFGCHATALSHGRLAVVQPLLASSLVFALPLGAWFDHRRLAMRELLGAIAVAGGLTLFLILANPDGGRQDASFLSWAVGIGACGLVCLPMVIQGRASSPRMKAALLGCAAGVLFGLCAALIKATVGRLDGGIVHTVADWHMWALGVVGWASMTLGESSLQVGRLAPALATQTALDPVTSLLLGVFAFHEAIHASVPGVIGAIAGIGIMVAGIGVLSTAAHVPPEVSAPAAVPGDAGHASAVVPLR